MMLVYHGTTQRRAERIWREGFRPRQPSRRVWFAERRGYALRRAKAQARRRRDRAVVLACDLDLARLRQRLGPRRLFHRGGVIAVNAPLPVTVVRSRPGWVDQPRTPEELADWVNRLLRLKRNKGVGHRHPGIQRLSLWVENRLAARPRGTIRPGELVQMARQWLPEFFQGVQIDRERLHARRVVKTIEVEVTADLAEISAREEEALELLEHRKARRRARGLSILAELDDPDLFDWCAMFLDDDSVEVRLTALRTMLCCREGDPGVILPLAKSEHKRIRAAAIAALTKHAGEEAPWWFARGLKDPNPCVRVATVQRLSELDPVEHPAIFELALYDPNPDIARRARKLTAAKGFSRTPVPR